MAYIDKDDIENVFGTSNVAAWSQLDATQRDTADTDRIAVAIALAEEYVESRLRECRYAVPLQGTSGTMPYMVKQWCAVKAGYWLYSSRGSASTTTDADADRYDKMMEETNAEISLVISGSIKPPLVRATTGPTVPVVLDDRGEVPSGILADGGGGWGVCP